MLRNCLKAVRKPHLMCILEIAFVFIFLFPNSRMSANSWFKLEMWAHDSIHLITMCGCSLFYWQQRVWSGVCSKPNQYAAAKQWKQIVRAIPALHWKLWENHSWTHLLLLRLNTVSRRAHWHVKTAQRVSFHGQKKQVENVKNAIDILNETSVHRVSRLTSDIRLSFWGLLFTVDMHVDINWIHLLTNVFWYFLSLCFLFILDHQLTHFLFSAAILKALSLGSLDSAVIGKETGTRDYQRDSLVNSVE